MYPLRGKADTRFPNPEPNTIIEYSVQGNLIRKRQCLAENDVVLSGTRGDVRSESVEHGLPPVEHGLPPVEHGLPSADRRLPSVDHILPSTNGRLPSTNHRSLSTVDLSG